jgi:hypothetical protein
MTPVAEHPKPTKPSTPKRRAPLRWVIVLQKEGHDVRIQPDWQTAVQVGDFVKFVSTEGFAQVNFEDTKGVNEHGHPITAHPFGPELKVIEDGEFHEVKHSCKGGMKCSIHLDGKTYGYKEPNGGKPDSPTTKEPAGSNICWKGGSNPVSC